MKNIGSTILAANIILNSEEEHKLKKSVIYDIDSLKVGVIGYLTPETNIIDFTGKIEYIDELIALSEEVKNLKQQNVDMIIALGHANIAKVIEIATEVDGIDLVINGRKNVYLWNGTIVHDSLTEKDSDFTVKQQSGKVVQIVQSHSYSDSLGKINVKFNNNGKTIEYETADISLDRSIRQDSEALQIIKSYSAEFKVKSEEVIGRTAVVLDGDTCKWDECNFGNLITDSIMYYYAVRYQGERWTDAPVAVIQSGAIAASIAPEVRPADVTVANLLTALQRESNLVAVTMNGTVLTQLLEHSVANYRRTNPSGQFLQYSGIRATYDLARDPGSRLVDAVVRCWSCNVPEFFSIDDWREYSLLMPLSLANGEEGYTMLIGLPRRNLAYDEITCAQEYIAQKSPVYPEVAGRITLLNIDAVPDSASSLNSLFAVTFSILSFVIRHSLINTL